MISIKDDQIEKSQYDRPVKLSKFKCWNKTRIFVLLLVLFFLSSVQINSLLFNFTVICMDDVVDNSTDSHWFESSSHKSFIFSSMALGSISGLFISIYLIPRLGAKIPLFLCGLFSILGTILFPLAVSFNYVSVIICRFLQGLGVSLLITAMGVVPVNWAPKSESSTFIAVLSCALQLSNVICMPISGVLCESQYGWRSVYYFFGISTIIVVFTFFVFYKDDPIFHRNVSSKELETIESEKVKTERQSVPYKEIFTDICVLSAWSGNFGGSLGFAAFVFYGPTYLSQVLHFDVKGTGFATALPFILSMIVKTVAGQLSDRCTFVSERTRFVICGCISRFSFSIGYIVMATTSSITIAQIAFTTALSLSGLNVMGTIKCLQLRCRQHCHFAVAVVGIFAYLIQFITPVIVGFVCPDNLPEQWSRFFIGVAIMITITNLPLLFFTTDKPAEYTKTHVEKVRYQISSDLS